MSQPGKTQSLIDVIFSNTPIKLKFFGHFNSSISFYDIIFPSFDGVFSNCRGKKQITFQNNKRIDHDVLFSSIDNYNWNFLIYVDVNSMVQTFKENIVALMDQVAQIKTKKVKHPLNNWFNEDVKKHFKSRK